MKISHMVKPLAQKHHPVFDTSQTDFKTEWPDTTSGIKSISGQVHLSVSNKKGKRCFSSAGVSRVVFDNGQLAEGIRIDKTWIGTLRFIHTDGSYVITELNEKGEREGLYTYYDQKGVIID